MVDNAGCADFRTRHMASPDKQQRIILCMKWGTKYGPEYVNRLYGMVRRHLVGDFRNGGAIYGIQVSKMNSEAVPFKIPGRIGGVSVAKECKANPG